MQLLSLDEVCKLLSISRATGNNWIKLGKIVPSKIDKRQYFFLRKDIENILVSIATGELNLLTSRRNKKQINKFALYDNYISNTHNKKLIRDIIDFFEQASYEPSNSRQTNPDELIANQPNPIELNDSLIRAILASFAIQFICQKNKLNLSNNVLESYLAKTLHPNFFNETNVYTQLVDDLLMNNSHLININLPVFNKIAKYDANEDTLGFVYSSLANLNKRKISGSYYTPKSVIATLVTYLTDNISLAEKTIFDPSCGSGNFLLHIGKYTPTPKLLYGQDIDLLAIQLARISFSLKFDITDIDFLYSHFTCANTLESISIPPFDIILGNPPWGASFTNEQLLRLEKTNNYKTIKKSGTESYSLFIEHGLLSLADKGILAFVVPEAISNINAHRPIREIILKNGQIKFTHFLGNVFTDVHCPAIILGIEKTTHKKIGVEKNRQISVNRFNFHIKDNLQDCLDSINNISNKCLLENNATFALGIVTGDNKSLISTTQKDNYEPIIRGRDVKKYNFAHNSFIQYIPQKFQQVAPEHIYRAQEKLIYRFICNSLVFAYDNEQKLTLNSCNILIPKIPDLDIKYILAILNSRVANFYFTQTFNSVKVLRSHLEQIPIPYVSKKEQQQVISMVNKILQMQQDLTVYNGLAKETSSVKTTKTITNIYNKHNHYYNKLDNCYNKLDNYDIKLDNCYNKLDNYDIKLDNCYNELDSYIMTLYHLKSDEQMKIIKTLKDYNLFLI